MPIWKTETGRELELLTPEGLSRLPDGTILYDIFGEQVIKGHDYIDSDTRGGYLAYGVDITPKSEE